MDSGHCRIVSMRRATTALPAWSAGCAFPEKMSWTRPSFRRGEAVRIAQQEVRALVRRRAPGEADGEGLRLEADSRSRRDLGEELVLHLPARRAKGAVVAVHRGGDARVLPRPAMDAVGDGDDGAASSTCAHIERAVSPWSWATALARRARRSPATVMLKGSPPISRSSAFTSSQPARDGADARWRGSRCPRAPAYGW